jgi:hypothetical protein
VNPTLITFSTVLLLALPVFAKPPVEFSKPIIYRGVCDASAAAPLDEHRFVTASDEENVLRIYDNEKGGLPLKTVDISRFLELDPSKPETDLEGAARIGDRIYWMSSHSRNKHGHDRPDRKRFFATDIKKGTAEIVPVGRPYKRLLEDLTADASLAKYGLADASRLPPKEKGGLNIEGLAATPEGQLLIGFRSPVPNGKALIIPLVNPQEVIQGKHARFGEAIELDLGGHGIRDMALKGEKVMIIAGSAQGGGSSQLYDWKIGKKEAKLVKGGRMKGVNPEAVVFYPNEAGYQVFCDSGRDHTGGVECKDVTSPSARAFQSFWVTDSKEP